MMRIHATNISGAGAVQLFSSLFPELAETGSVQEAYVSQSVSKLSCDVGKGRIEIHKVKRILPKMLSRTLECTVFSGYFRGSGTLLVLGDIPLFGVRPQAVLVHSAHMLSDGAKFKFYDFKFQIARWLFAFNSRYVAAFVVQSKLMKVNLESSYPKLGGRVYVIPHPPPKWLIDSKLCRSRAEYSGVLTLFYPAAGYPHKNHDLLQKLNVDGTLRTVLHRIIVTLAPEERPELHSKIVDCVGPLDERDMLRHYGFVDALLFLSKKESYGFPLLEAMWIGLPIVCPDLPYARSMCGDEAIYFDADSEESLREAILRLHSKLRNGWWPDWKHQLAIFPKNWADCAVEFVRICELIATQDSNVNED